jgi:drug/metabolite transporter (DMT)-like permease
VPTKPFGSNYAKAWLARVVIQLPQPVRAILWMLGTLLSLSLMGITGRELSAVFDTFEILFIRNIVGFVIIALVISYQGVGLTRTRRPGLHVFRNLIHLCAVATWFYGISVMPLVEVFVLESTLPIWVVLLAAPLLGERITQGRATAIGLGFLGVLVILRPGLTIIDPISLVVLAGAVGFAGANVATKALTRTEQPMTILFWMFTVQLTVSGVIAAPGISWPPTAMWPWVVGVGLSGMSAHYCMARSLKLAEVGLMAPLHYLRVPLIGLVGWLMYDEIVDIWFVFGAIIIFLGIMATVRSAQTSAPPTAPR